MDLKPKRVFICAERRFPRGDAGANRVQYIARALMQAGHEVIVVSIGENRAQDKCKHNQLYVYNGVKYRNVPLRDGFYKRLDAHVFSGFNTVRILKDIGLNSEDFVVIYTTNPIYGHIVERYTYRNLGATVAMDVVEKFQPFQYRFGRFDPMYLLFSLCFKAIHPRTGKVIAISKHLEKHFKSMSLSVLRLPALIDPSEFVVRKPSNDNIVRMIYSGLIGKKESLGVMLEGFLMLSDAEKERIEFHVTRTTKKELMTILGAQAQLVDQMGKMLHIHEWMSYESLMRLYDSIDFLFFARNQNEATISNFPSKIPELLACGIPPIANKVGDFPEYLEDGTNSILFEKCTALECCSAIRRALDLGPDQLKKLIENSRKCSELKFDFRLWADKIHEFVQS